MARRRAGSSGIPSFEEAAGIPKSKRKGKKERVGFLYDPETGERHAFDLSSAEGKDAFDLAKAQGMRTASQQGRQDKAASGAKAGFLKSFGESLGKDISRKVTSKRGGKATARRLGRNLATALGGGGSTSGVSLLSKALPIAVRLTPIAAAVGALWYLSSRADDKRKAAMVAEYAANQEAYLKRPMTETELKAYMPEWSKMADARLMRKLTYAPTGATLR